MKFELQRFAGGGGTEANSSGWRSEGHAGENQSFSNANSNICLSFNVSYSEAYSGEIEGSETAITLTETIDAAKVTVSLGGGATCQLTDITVNIDGIAYNVNENGKLFIPRELPEFGLMSKADKQKLDKMPTDFSNFITGGEMTAEGFVLTNSAGVGVVTIPAQA